MTPDHEERIERLEKALLELVYFNSGELLCWEKGWTTGVHGDVNVDDIIGDLLDKYKPTKEAE